MVSYVWLTIVFALIGGGYPLVRGAMDWRDGLRWLGAVGVGIGLIVLASGLIPIQTHAVKIDLPSPQ